MTDGDVDVIAALERSFRDGCECELQHEEPGDCNGRAAMRIVSGCGVVGFICSNGFFTKIQSAAEGYLCSCGALAIHCWSFAPI